MRHKPEPYDSRECGGGKGTQYCARCGAWRPMWGNRPAGGWTLKGERSLSCPGAPSQEARSGQGTGQGDG